MMKQPTARYVFGQWRDDKKPLTAQQVQGLLDEAEARRAEIADYPSDKMLAVLELLGQCWARADYPFRIEALERLPNETGFSREMVERGLDYLPVLFSAENLQKKIDTELRQIPRTAGFHFDDATSTCLRWHPIGVVLHVLAGNVFLGAAGSLVEGLVTGNVNILKMSSSEKVFLPLLISSLLEIDEEGVLARSLAVVDYSSSQEEVLSTFKNGVDGIVVWGGEQAVRGYRNFLPARTRLIIFGPKLSVAVITEQGLLAKGGVEDIARSLALDVAIWDQNACTAPQVCFVQGKERAKEIVEAMASALEAEANTTPAGTVELHAACEIRKMRTVFEIAEIRGEGMLRESKDNLDWTVFLDHSLVIEPSPLHRTIRVVPFEEIEEVTAAVESMRGYMQTVGLLASRDELFDLSGRFAQAGAMRVVEIGAMAAGEVDDPHDGAYDLPQFLHLVTTRLHLPSPCLHPIDVVAEHERRRLIDERLRCLIARARLSAHYGPILEHLKMETVDDLPKMPVLKRDAMEAGTPPHGTGLCTGPYTGGYVSRSGGSTGEPKFSIYDGHDWEHMIAHAVRLFRSMGIERGDRLANCMIAGDLYGSFVSFDHINCRTGVTTFAFGGNAEAGVFLDMWRNFDINVIQGVPTLFMPFLRQAKEIDPSFTMEKVMFAGSPLSATDREWLISVLDVKRLASVIGANDGGQIAYQCAKQTGALHHTTDDFNYIEIVDEDGEPVAEGEAGRILITSLLKLAYPLIRYDIGDRGRFVSGHCSCGRTTRVFEYLGRSDDVMTVGILNIKAEDFETALRGLSVSEFQLVARQEDAGEYLLLRVESSERGEAYAGQVRQRILECMPLMVDRLESGKLLRLEIECLSPGSMPRNARSGKLKTMLDER